MNTDNLHKLINRYTDDYYTVNNSEHDEVFKWAAIKQFFAMSGSLISIRIYRLPESLTMLKRNAQY